MQCRRPLHFFVRSIRRCRVERRKSATKYSSRKCFRRGPLLRFVSLNSLSGVRRAASGVAFVVGRPRAGVPVSMSSVVSAVAASVILHGRPVRRRVVWCRVFCRCGIWCRGAWCRVVRRSGVCRGVVCRHELVVVIFHMSSWYCSLDLVFEGEKYLNFEYISFHYASNDLFLKSLIFGSTIDSRIDCNVVNKYLIINY